MSVNSTMNALANVLKAESGPMDVEDVVPKEFLKEEEKKLYEDKIAALPTPTQEELVDRVSQRNHANSMVLTDVVAVFSQAMELTSRMTDFNCDFHPDERSKFQMRQLAHKLFHSLVISLPEKVDPKDPVWQRNAKEFMLACEEMDKWLGENEDDEAYTDDEDMSPA